MSARLLVTLVVSLLSVSIGCSGSPTPSTPAAPAPVTTSIPVPPAILAANLVWQGGFGLSFPGCNFTGFQLLGIAVATCPRFNGSLLNAGAGCASGVRGTTTVMTSTSAVVGSAGWTYANVVRPGETFGYSGGTINAPARGEILFETRSAWDNVRCP